MNRSAVILGLSCCLALAGCATQIAKPQAAVPSTARAANSIDALREQVLATERAFAKTMVDRNFAAFAAFIANEAVFVSAPQPLRGKGAVLAAWKPYYDAPLAPFSWQPERVEVLDSGTLALSAGPVRDSSGRVVGNYTSIWRREAPDTWRIVFDIGTESCVCTPQ